MTCREWLGSTLRMVLRYGLQMIGGTGARLSSQH